MFELALPCCRMTLLSLGIWISTAGNPSIFLEHTIYHDEQMIYHDEGVIYHNCSQSLGIQSSCQRTIGVYNHLLSKVFRFHDHSQKVIGSLGNGKVGQTFLQQPMWLVFLAEKKTQVIKVENCLV